MPLGLGTQALGTLQWFLTLAAHLGHQDNAGKSPMPGLTPD